MIIAKTFEGRSLRGNKAEMKITIENTYESNVIHLPIPVAMKTFLSLTLNQRRN